MRRYSDHLFREFFQVKLENDPKERLDFDRWEPAESDTFMVVRHFLDWYKGTLETADEEAAKEYLDLAHKIQKEGIAACKDDIQGTMCEIFWAVDGEIEEYYKNSPDILEMMNLTVLKESVKV